MMKIEEEETRKGPWTEQEDVQLTDYVCLFGQRRWEFIAKVSGLRRTGKSCRLRWVNYLHPGLKRGRISPQEERIILKLHSRWGNRWSRIARKLPGRTDNQIKNYWRTRMRKKAQEKQQSSSPTLSLSSSSSPSSMNCHTLDTLNKSHVVDEKECAKGCYTMDEIWKEITCLEEVYKEGCEGCSYPCLPMTSPLWYNCFESVWGANIDEDIKQHEENPNDYFYF